MYLIYVKDVKNNKKTSNVKVLDFSDNMDESYNCLIEHVKDFIYEHEGKKKWDIVFIDNETDITKLRDGYYLIKKDNEIKVYNKTSELVNTGWIINSQETNHNLSLEYIYSIVEFQRHLLNRFITDSKPVVYQRTTTDIPDKLKPNLEQRENIDSIIEEIKSLGFKPRPFKLKLC